MDLTTRVLRTWLCSVVFLDIVGYSQHPVSRQLEIKKRFNDSVSDALRTMPTDDRLILDTGDGAALCFFGDPEQALYCAIRLRDGFSGGVGWPDNRMQVRFGINLGPVKLMRDVNAQLNAIGDGINDAQRVMAFADPDQILISRSFYDVVERLSEDNHRLFQYLGTRNDKHAREHGIYAVITPGGTADITVVRAADAEVESSATDNAVPGSERDEVYRTSIIDITSVAQVSDPDVAQPFNGPAPVWEPATLDAVAKQLARYAGPLARIMVAKDAKQTAHLNELYARLADRLSSEDDKLRFLASQAALSQPAMRNPNPAAQSAAGRPHDAGGASTMGLSKAVIEAARAKLVRYVGPIATVMVARAARAAESESDFYLRLVDFIESEADKSEFIREVGAGAQKAGLGSV